MGVYILSAEEIQDKFEKFLMKQNGEVRADAIAKAWNKLARKWHWEDKLKAITKK
ncbi:hypothetical protein LCGC14_1060900 [marine sediment metagenome]|uniref:Uncharacterized protein n=1 Tax=marine sediment metagenome TaxID=412755 RepID=A0A0F9MQN1_9ZZZZ